MGGASQQSIDTQNQITQQQVTTEQQALAQSQAQYTQSQQELAPAMNYYQQLVSGNPQQTMAAAAPQISNITGGYNASVEQINNNVAPGAARDYALSQVPIQQNSQVASTLNSVTQNAYGSLAALGSGSESASLQFLGGGVSAGNAASSSNQVTMQAQEQSKADTMGFLGSLIGASGTAAAGIFHHA